MDALPVHPGLVAVQAALLAAGLVVLARAVFTPERRKRWLETNALPHWNVSGLEVAALLMLMVFDGFILQAAVQVSLARVLPPVAAGQPASGLQTLVGALSFQLGTLLGWALFHRLQGRWQPEIGAPPPPVSVPAYRLPWSKVLVAAATVVLLAGPLLLATSLLWTQVLELMKLPQDPQDLVGVFARTESPLIFAGLVVVACVMAPVTEELIFRRVLYRYLRQRFGRGLGLLASASLFGLLHGNWASFAPLCVLGVLFALAYEKTGDLRVPIVAHGLFNLTTTAYILGGAAGP